MVLKGRTDVLKGRTDALKGRTDVLKGRTDALKGRTDVLKEKPVSVPFCLAQILYRLVFGHTQRRGVQFNC